jgi:O-antigen ligase
MSVLSTVVALVPLVILPGVLFHYDVTPKVIVLLAGAGAALLAGLPAGVRPAGWLRAVLVGQACWLAVSTLASTDRGLSFTGANWRRFGLVTQIALLIFTYLLAAGLTAERVRRLLRVIVASGSLVALYGMGQYFGWDPWIPRSGYHIGEGVWTIIRPPGTLGHAGYFAVYLLHVAFAGAALAWTEGERRWRWAGGVAAALAVTAIVLSGTRAGLVGLAAGAAVMAVRRRPRISAARVGVGAAALAGLVLFYFSAAGQPLRSRTRWYREEPLGGGRPALWADTLRMASARWLTGFGPETFSAQFPRFQSEALARLYPDRYYESPHNVFLDVLAGQGAPGLILLVLVCGLAFRDGWRAGPRADALLAGLTASLAANQFLAFTLPTALLFYVTVALMAAPAGAAPTEPRRGIAVVPVALALLAAAFSLGWSDYWLARTKRSLDAGEIRRAMTQYERARGQALPGLDTDLWYSRALMAAAPAAWQPALEAARRAAERSEQRANAHYNVAAFYAMQNDFARTEESLRAAIGWAPRWYKPRWMLARLLEQAGRPEEAAAELSRATELNGGKNPGAGEAR